MSRNGFDVGALFVAAGFVLMRPTSTTDVTSAAQSAASSLASGVVRGLTPAGRPLLKVCGAFAGLASPV